MVLISGVEITKNSLSNHRSAHMLGLGISEWVNPDQSIEETLIQIRNQDALTIAAHPISNRKIEKQTLHLWDERERYAPLFDAWEVGSGVNFFSEVASSGLPMIANNRSSSLFSNRRLENSRRLRAERTRHFRCRS